MLGNRLKNLRIEKGCTLTAVAKEVGVSTASLSKYEHGIHIPGDLALSRLADFYGTTMEELMKEKDIGEPMAAYAKRKLCPWRTRTGMDQETGNTMTWFLPCMEGQCMAYEEGLCTMMRSRTDH